MSVHPCLCLISSGTNCYSDICLLYQPDCYTPKQRYPHFSAAAQCQPLFRFPSATYQQTQHTSAVTQNNKRTFLLPILTGQHFRECVQGREAATVRVSCSLTSAVTVRETIEQFFSSKRRSLRSCPMRALCTYGTQVDHLSRTLIP